MLVGEVSERAMRVLILSTLACCTQPTPERNREDLLVFDRNRGHLAVQADGARIAVGIRCFKRSFSSNVRDPKIEGSQHNHNR